MKRPITYHHIALDAPTYVGDNEVLERRHFVSGGSVIGRILFATPEPTVVMRGDNATVQHCLFEGGHTAIYVTANNCMINHNQINTSRIGVSLDGMLG